VNNTETKKGNIMK